jgi:hypothetical protein
VLHDAERVLRGAVRRCSGALEHVRQRRRWRARSAGVGGGLMVQFCHGRSVLLTTFCSHGNTHSAHNHVAARALAHHVPGAFAHLAAGQLAGRRNARLRLPQAPCQLGAEGDVLDLAVERVLDELVAVLEQVGAELPARARETVQRVEIELAGELSNNTVRLTWLAVNWARSTVLAIWFDAHG